MDADRLVPDRAEVSRTWQEREQHVATCEACLRRMRPLHERRTPKKCAEGARLTRLHEEAVRAMRSQASTRIARSS